MKTFNGIDFKNYLPSFHWVADLQYYEGSLLSEYRTDRGEIYAFLWCDASDTHNRWLVAKTTKRSLYGLNAGIFSIRNFFEQQILEDSVYLLDIDAEEQISHALLTKLSNIANDYLPEEGILIAPEFRPVNEYYALLIDGELSTGDLMQNIPNQFRDLYNLIKLGIDYKAQGITKLITDTAWKKDYSVADFFRGLNQKSLFGVNEIQYASPGYIQFDADNKIGLEVSKEINYFIANRSAISQFDLEIGKYIKYHKLNNEETSLDAHLTWLGEQGEKLMQYFTEPTWAWLSQHTKNTFVAVKIARAYVKRIRTIADYVESNKVILPRM